MVGLQDASYRVGDNDGAFVFRVGLAVDVGLTVATVGLLVGGSVGVVCVGDFVGLIVTIVGLTLGAELSSLPVGDALGDSVGRVGLLVGTFVVGDLLGPSVGGVEYVGDVVGLQLAPWRLGDTDGLFVYLVGPVVGAFVIIVGLLVGGSVGDV